MESVIVTLQDKQKVNKTKSTGQHMPYNCPVRHQFWNAQLLFVIVMISWYPKLMLYRTVIPPFLSLFCLTLILGHYYKHNTNLLLLRDLDYLRVKSPVASVVFPTE